MPVLPPDFFRVNYDVQNWLQLAQWGAGELNVGSRVMLLEDALVLARTGRLDHAVALQYADSLRGEPTEDAAHEVWEAARTAFSSALDTFLLGTEQDSVYKVRGPATSHRGIILDESAVSTSKALAQH